MFSDRLTGARNPARLPTTIQSRRIRCAPIGWWGGTQFHCTIARPPRQRPDFSPRPPPGAHIIEGMRNLCALALLLFAAVVSPAAGPTTKLNIVVKTQGGHPIDRASVVVKCLDRSVSKLGK